MPELLFMLIGSVLVNVLTVRGLLNPGGRVPGDTSHARSMALVVSTIPAALVAAAGVHILGALVLHPLEADYLYLLLLVAVSAGAAWATQQLLTRLTARMPTESPGLVAANCVVIVAMSGIAGGDRGPAVLAVLACLFAAGFALLLLAMTELAARLDDAVAPGPFKGAPLLFLSAGIAALALLGLGGLLPF